MPKRIPFLFAILFLAEFSLAAEPVAFAGAYRLDVAHSADVEAAIEGVVTDLSFVTRPLARNRLKETNTPPQEVHIAYSSAEVVITLAAPNPPKLPLDGRKVDWTASDGEVVPVDAKLFDGAIVETFHGKQGSRENRFSLSKDGKTLTMDVRIESSHLNRPLTYRLVFLRIP